MKKAFLNFKRYSGINKLMFLGFLVLFISCKKDEAVVEPVEEKLTKQEAVNALTAGNVQSWNLEELKIEEVTYQGQNVLNTIPPDEITKAESAAKGDLAGIMTFISAGSIYQMQDVNNVVTEVGAWSINDNITKLTLTPNDMNKKTRVFDIIILSAAELKVYSSHQYIIDVNKDNVQDNVTLKVMLRLVP